MNKLNANAGRRVWSWIAGCMLLGVGATVVADDVDSKLAQLEKRITSSIDELKLPTVDPNFRHTATRISDRIADTMRDQSTKVAKRLVNALDDALIPVIYSLPQDAAANAWEKCFAAFLKHGRELNVDTSSIDEVRAAYTTLAKTLQNVSTGMSIDRLDPQAELKFVGFHHCHRRCGKCSTCTTSCGCDAPSKENLLDGDDLARARVNDVLSQPVTIPFVMRLTQVDNSRAPANDRAAFQGREKQSPVQKGCASKCGCN